MSLLKDLASLLALGVFMTALGGAALLVAERNAILDRGGLLVLSEAAR